MAKKQQMQKTVEAVPEKKVERKFGLIAVMFMAIVVLLAILSFRIISLETQVTQLKVDLSTTLKEQNKTATMVEGITQWGSAFTQSVVYTFGQVANYTQVMDARQNNVEYSLKLAGLLKEAPIEYTNATTTSK